jgi:hypothetical protein
VVETEFNPAEYISLDDVDGQRMDELEHFFVVYNQAEGRQFKPIGRRGVQCARELLKKSS